MYSRRPCFVLAGFLKEENEYLNMLGKAYVYTLSEMWISKEVITKIVA